MTLKEFDKDISTGSNSLNIFVWPLVIISLLATLLFIFFEINWSLWLDEAYSVLLADRNFDEIIPTMENDSTPPFYYLVLAVWIRIFGIDPIAVRSLSGIFYVLCLIAIYKLGKSVYDKKTGLLCSFLYMLSQVAIRHSHNARMYSLLGLLGILSFLFFFRLFFIKTNSKKDAILYILINIAGTFTHYWFMFNILSQIICYFSLFSRALYKKFLVTIFLSVIPFLILWVPILWLQINNGSTSWMGKPDILNSMAETLLNFYGDKKALLVYGAFFIIIIIQFKGLKIRLQKLSMLKNFIIEKRSLVFLITLFVLLLIPLFISQVTPIYMVGRYTIVTLFPFVMLVGALLSRFGNKFLLLICCYSLVIGGSALYVIYKAHPPKYSDKLTTEYLIQHAQNNDTLIFTSLSRLGIDYYLRLMKPEKILFKIHFPSELASHPIWKDVDKMLAQKHILEQEAKDIVARLDDSIADNNKVWLFYGDDPEINQILKKKLDRQFFLIATRDLQGTSFTQVLIYQKTKPSE